MANQQNSGMEKWAGKVALVTGASKGLGKCITQTLANYKMNVIACARSKDKLEELQQYIIEKGGHLDYLVCDMSKTQSVIEIFKYIAERYGTLHVVFNNAGVSFPDYFLPKRSCGDVHSFYEPTAMAERMNMYSHWSTMLKTNVLAISICCKEALNIMVRAGVKDGVIINVSSMLGKFAQLVPTKKEGENEFYMHVYEGTKFAVTCISQCIRLELQMKHPEASGIRIVNLCPAWIKTNFSDRLVKGSKSSDTPTEADPKDIEGFYEGKAYLDPQDVVDFVCAALCASSNVQIDEILIQALNKSS